MHARPRPRRRGSRGHRRFPRSRRTCIIPEILKFLIDRTGYIKQLEQEATPDSLARIDNLRELVNAAMDSRDRGETLAEFLDHAALVSDVDTYDPRGTVTLMTLHSAKGLEFGLVFLVGHGRRTFPHSRAFNDPDQMEEERRLCYVGMTRAMDHLVLSNARYRRRYGTDMPDATCLRDFWRKCRAVAGRAGHVAYADGSVYQDSDFGERHFSYEDEDQSALRIRAGRRRPVPGRAMAAILAPSTIPSTTLPISLLRGARSSTVRRFRWRSRREARLFVPDSA